MISGVRNQESGVREPAGRAAAALPFAAAFFLFAFLLVPIFAHGCHGDDVDHEPSAAPPTPLSQSEARP